MALGGLENEMAEAGNWANIWYGVAGGASATSARAFRRGQHLCWALHVAVFPCGLMQ
jgi:hypothetical protein